MAPAGVVSALRDWDAAVRTSDELSRMTLPKASNTTPSEVAYLRAFSLEMSGQKEQAVKDIEHLMASPGFYDDRATADRSVAQRQQLLAEVEALMSEWESLQTAAEAKGGG